VLDDFGRRWVKNTKAWEIDAYVKYNITKISHIMSQEGMLKYTIYTMQSEIIIMMEKGHTGYSIKLAN